MTDKASSIPKAVAATPAAGHLTVSHGKREFSRKLALTPVPRSLQGYANAVYEANVLKNRPASASSSSTAVVKKPVAFLSLTVTTNGVEGFFGNVGAKLSARRKRGSKHVSAESLATAYLLEFPGLLGVVRALSAYQDSFLDRMTPQDFAAACALYDVKHVYVCVSQAAHFLKELPAVLVILHC